VIGDLVPEGVHMIKQAAIGIVSVDDRTVGYVDFDREFLVIRLDRVKALDQPLE
jgi:hypothetical protein